LLAALTGDYGSINYSPTPSNDRSLLTEVAATKNADELKFTPIVDDIVRRVDAGTYFDFRNHDGDETAEINSVTGYLRRRGFDAPEGYLNPRMGDRDPRLVAMRLSLIDPDFVDNFTAGKYKNANSAMVERLQHALIGKRSVDFPDVNDAGLEEAIRVQIRAKPPAPVQLNAEIPTTDEFRKFAATIYGEAGASSKDAWRAVGHVIMNRVGYREWKKRTTVTEVVENTGFDAYTQQTSQYKSAYNYLTGAADKAPPNLQEMLQVAANVYAGEDPDLTGGAVLYYSPKAQASLVKSHPEKYHSLTPDWKFSQLSDVTPTETKNDDFLFYKYK
jgi:spore germination cell wall hydrolase CwlJ-like protein